MCGNVIGSTSLEVPQKVEWVLFYCKPVHLHHSKTCIPIYWSGTWLGISKNLKKNNRLQKRDFGEHWRLRRQHWLYSGECNLQLWFMEGRKGITRKKTYAASHVLCIFHKLLMTFLHFSFIICKIKGPDNIRGAQLSLISRLIRETWKCRFLIINQFQLNLKSKASVFLTHSQMCISVCPIPVHTLKP